MLDELATILLVFSGAALTAHLLSAMLARYRLSDEIPVLPAGNRWPAVTLIRPVCGLDTIERATLASTFGVRGTDIEVLFCVADKNDPVIPYLEGLIAQHPGSRARILVGDGRGTANPKLNNLVKGWQAASKDWVVMVDSNVALPPDYLERLFSTWSADTGLVSAPPIGGRPIGFWAEVECAFLNTYQARWQFAADAVGFGFAQGKTLFWRRKDLSAWGGIEALGAELAEDAAATKLVRGAGRKVRLAPVGSLQPLGGKAFSEVWTRQARWARLRRMSFPWFFVPEILTGWLPPALGLAGAAWLLDWPLVPVLLGFIAIWLSIEHCLARAVGWHVSALAPLAALVRDLMLPLLWGAAWLSRGYVWRGNRVNASRTDIASLEDEDRPSPVAAR